MTSQLCILYLEDNPSDAELVALQLKRDGFDADLKRVDTRAGFEAALEGPIDLILADYVVPGFSGLEAIKLLRDRRVDIPVILVSGTIGEEEAVEAMKAGAFDYLLKGKLTRLGVAVTNALHEKRLRDEKRTAEHALRASEERYRILFESNPMPMWVYSTATLRFLAVNDAAVEHYGYTRDEFLRMTIEDIRPAEELPRLHVDLESAGQRRQQSGPWIHRKKDGTLIEVEILSYDLESIEPSARLVLANDVTEKRRAEEALRESEERLRLLFATSPDAIMLLDMDDPEQRFPIADCNDAACRIHGYAREELLGQPIRLLEASHSDIVGLDRWISEEIHQKGVARFETSHRHKDGHVFPVEISVSRLRVGGRNFSLSIERDISERKEAENRLRLSDQILHGVKALVLVADADAQIIYVSPSAKEMLGYAPEELLGEGWWRHSRADAAEANKNKELLKQILHGEQPLSNAPYEREIRARTGESRWISWQDAMGPNHTIVGVGHDITQRKRAEEALREAESRYRTLIEQLPMVVYVTSAHTYAHASYVSPQIEATLGYKVEEWTTDPKLWQKALHPEDMPSILKRAESINQTGEPFEMEYRMIARDGHVVWFQDRAILIRDPEGNPVFWRGLMIDITERKQAEKALQESERRYHALFEDSPISIWEEDFSELKKHLESLKQQGVSDLQRYFTSDPEAVSNCASLIRILDVNRAALKMYRAASKEELLASTTAILSKGEMQHMREDLVAITEGRTSNSWEGADETLTGEPLEISLSWSVAPGHEDDFSRVVVTTIDVTERKRAEEELHQANEFAENLIQTANVIFLQLDTSGNVLRINNAAEEITGYGRAEVEGRNWFEMLVPKGRYPEVWKEFERIIKPGEVVEIFENPILTKQGEEKYILWKNHVLRSGEWATGTISFGLDITERKRTEEILKQRDDELQRRNRELERLYRSSESLLVGALADLSTLAQNIVETLLREFEQSNSSLLLVNKETRELERVAVAGPYAERVSRAKLSLDKPGLVAKAIRTGRVINVPDVAADPDYIPNWESARSELVIPLKVGEEVIGALDVQSPEPDAFHTDDERLMTIFAERAAFGLERTRLHEQTSRQLERLESLRTIDLAISNSLDLRISLNIVLEQVIQQLGVDAASVLLFKPGLARLEYFVGRGFRTHEIEATSVRIGEGLAGRVAMEKQVIHMAEIPPEGPAFSRRDMFVHEEFVSYFGVPLIAKGEVKGVLEIFHRRPIRADMEWLNFLDALGWQTAIAVDNALLFEGIQRPNFDLAMAYDDTIEGWSRALDLRDRETEGHTQRVTEMSLRLAEALGFYGADLVHIRRGALLHDIGKMGVPDHILLKPDALTEEEWVSMRRHPQFAFDMLQPIVYLRPALHIPYCHHEKWDGTGYPRGLAGTHIPLEARLFSIVDVWDAVTSDRPYRKAWPRHKALKYIHEQSGKHFDPRVVEIFLKEIIGEQ